MKRKPESNPRRTAPESERRPARPFVFINMAMTADGKIATANRAVSSFGSTRDKTHLLLLRATADAVMAGARTVDSNPVNMGPGGPKYRALRRRRGLAEYNLRVIVSRSGTVDPNAEIFRHRFSPIIILTTTRVGRKRLASLRSVADVVRVCGETEIDFNDTLHWLGSEYNVKRLLCEGGGQLNDALFRAGLVDELNLTVCPCIFGGETAPTIADGQGAASLVDAYCMTLKSARQRGNEMFFVYQRDARRQKKV